jgi:hypothetical protein
MPGGTRFLFDKAAKIIQQALGIESDDVATRYLA